LRLHGHMPPRLRNEPVKRLVDYRADCIFIAAGCQPARAWHSRWCTNSDSGPPLLIRWDFDLSHVAAAAALRIQLAHLSQRCGRVVERSEDGGSTRFEGRPLLGVGQGVKTVAAYGAHDQFSDVVGLHPADSLA
jgi:hypothetical protein